MSNALHGSVAKSEFVTCSTDCLKGFQGPGNPRVLLTIPGSFTFYFLHCLQQQQLPFLLCLDLRQTFIPFSDIAFVFVDPSVNTSSPYETPGLRKRDEPGDDEEPWVEALSAVPDFSGVIDHRGVSASTG